MPMLEGGRVTAATSIHKLFWASFHQAMGELAVDVLGPAGVAGDVDDSLVRLFLWSRADTIYGGSHEIQRNVIGEQALGLPREPKLVGA
jgi:alkylation response protein AidB-like acyl-CoA dehydrogenase